MPDSNPDYLVGHGRPPLHTRFKKGRSGNPSGRPRGGKNTTAVMLATLAKRVAVPGGGRRRVARLDLGLERLIDKFVEGDLQASRLVLGLLMAIERRAPVEPEGNPPFEEADKLVIANLLARLRGDGLEADGGGAPKG